MVFLDVVLLMLRDFLRLFSHSRQLSHKKYIIHELSIFSLMTQNGLACQLHYRYTVGFKDFLLKNPAAYFIYVLVCLVMLPCREINRMPCINV